MTAKSTVNQYVVTPANVQANTDAALYAARYSAILAAAATAAAALIAQGQPQGVPVVAVLPVLTAFISAYPPEVTAATAIAGAPFA